MVRGVEGQGGTALAYVSDDMIHWEYKGPLYVANMEAYPFLGPVWELPVLLPLGEDRDGAEKHLFLISPVGAGADVEVFYWVGTFDREEMKFYPDSDEPQLIDVGDFSLHRSKRHGGSANRTQDHLHHRPRRTHASS